MEKYGPYFNLLANIQNAADESELLQTAFEAHKELYGNEFLEEIKNKANKLNDFITMFVVDAQRQQKRKEEKTKDKFIEEFSRSKPTLTKKEIKDLCGMTKGTLKSHSQEFIDHGQSGVDSFTFLTWIKLYRKGIKYHIFKSNAGA